ncbi:MAG: Asp-tRNA(Asn)/Glu-tRNA(Gln) amidotransferase subunit GatC [Pyramidobacter sp.]|nr:Asp-tRNA(Asn)/Glu-tRNA(Gln) amidotransferase subunit GatC [Pyramidobacter sp.]
MPKLTQDEVLKIGKLARLEIAEEELESLSNHFNSILDYFTKLEELDLSAVDPFTVDDAASMRMREDTVTKNTMRDAILDQSPSRDGDFIRVPKIGGDK